jgi:hypothetical protein
MARVVEAMTDAHGRYRVENLTPGKVYVFVTSHDAWWWHKDAETGSENVDFTRARPKESKP